MPSKPSRATQGVSFSIPDAPDDDSGETASPDASTSHERSALLARRRSSAASTHLPIDRPAGFLQIAKLVVWAAGVVLAVVGLVVAIQSPFGRGGDNGSPPAQSAPWTPPGYNLSTAPVAYDGKSVYIDGKRVLLMCGAVHYPRSDPEEWLVIMQRAKEGGLNCIESLVFWDLHEPRPDNFIFDSPPHNLTRFLDTAALLDLYVVLRLGPYICGEWDFGGLPVWLLDRKKFPHVEFRTSDKIWQDRMKLFLSKTLDVVRPFLRTTISGGPVVMLQIENEYGWLEEYNGLRGLEHRRWCEKTAVEIEERVPWIMCAQDNAEVLVNTCNGFYCDQWIADHRAQHPFQPPLWTEAWSGWFQKWGEPKPTRPAEDLAFAVARWFALGGSGVNYYMYHGGTNFARTAGGPLITTTYDYDAPLSSYGMPNEPKYSHLARLHFLIREFEDAMFWDGEKEVADIKVLSRRDRTGLTLVGNSSSGNWLEAHVHGDPTTNSTTGQLAFLSNIAEDGEADIEFNGVKVTLKAWSVVILARKGKTGKGVEVEKEKWTVRFDSAVPRKGTGGKELDGRRGIVEGYSGTVDETEGGDAGRPSFVEPSAVWEAHEPLSVLPEGFPKDPRKSHSRTIRNAEQLRTGLGASDYQVHRLSYLPERSQKLEVRVTGVYEVGYVFLGNSTCGGCMGAKSLICTCRTDERVLRPRQQAPSPAPAVDLTILTATIGLDNYGARLEETVKGITGRVEVNGRDAGTWEWKVLVGLYGEAMQYFDPTKFPLTASLDNLAQPIPVAAPGNSTPSPIPFNPWTPLANPKSPSSPIPTWFRLSFPAPSIPRSPNRPPLFLDSSKLGKGFAWVNGRSLGRYWNATSASELGVEAMVVKGETERWAWRKARGYDRAYSSAAKPRMFDTDELQPASDAPSNSSTARCDYRGPFWSFKCPTNLGEISQNVLLIPWSWIDGKRTVEVVLFEERPRGTSPGRARLQVGEA